MISSFVLILQIPIQALIQVKMVIGIAGLLNGAMFNLSVLSGLGFILALSSTTAAAPIENELNALFDASVNCSMPCWNGIQPGQTTLEEAIIILDADPRVEDYLVSLNKLSWWWNGDQESIFDATGRAFNGRIEFENIEGVYIVTNVVLDTTISYGDIELAYGEPDTITLYTVDGTSDVLSGVVHLAHFAEDDVYIFNILNCPMTVPDFWQSPSMVSFGHPTLVFEGEQIDQTDHRLPANFFLNNGDICS